jgi:hypothetical protein
VLWVQTQISQKSEAGEEGQKKGREGRDANAGLNSLQCAHEREIVFLMTKYYIKSQYKFSKWENLKFLFYKRYYKIFMSIILCYRKFI